MILKRNLYVVELQFHQMFRLYQSEKILPFS